METRKRPDIPWVLVCALTLAALLAVIVFAPIWRCPGCDPDLDLRTMQGDVAVYSLGGSNPDHCDYCGRSKRASLFRRWQIREENRQIMGFTFPLF